jgi:hypothetical protein
MMNSFNNARNEPDARGVDASYVNQGCPMEGNTIIAPFRTSLQGIVHLAASLAEHLAAVFATGRRPRRARGALRTDTGDDSAVALALPR